MDRLIGAKDLNALYAEDDRLIRTNTEKILGRIFNKLYVASDGLEALELYRREKVHLIITDIKMPLMTGLELATAIRKENTKIPIFITSGYSESADLMEAIRLSLSDYLLKPYSYEKLMDAIRSCVQQIEDSGNLFVPLAPDRHYNALSRTLKTPEGEILLNGKECGLLELLIRFRGRLVTKEQIEVLLYQDEPMTEAALKNLMHKLRKKIGKESITNVHSAGFILH